ncbi:hypothetical protein UYO_2243 [Lachnospiraceae bacterium JC7]|nr:hypothetical protein UYO_2243 [Lachnospiraceae bacterium JC7]
MKKLIFQIVFVIATIVALGGLYLIFNGSLEMFPTEEQIEKTRIAGWIIFLAGVFIDGIIGRTLIRNSRM